MTAVAIRYVIVGRKQNGKTIIEVFKEHNTKAAELVSKILSNSTLELYNTYLKHIQDFMKRKYKEFVPVYEHYLKTVRNCANNSAVL